MRVLLNWTLDLEIQVCAPAEFIYVVFLGETLHSYTTSLHFVRVQMGTSELNAVCWGGGGGGNPAMDWGGG